MHSSKAFQRWTVLAGILFLTSPVAARVVIQGQPESTPARQRGAQDTSTKAVTARGCVRDSSEVGGQGGGGQAWQGSIAGHVLTDVQIGLSSASDSRPPTRSSAATASAQAASSQGPVDSAPRMLLILGIADNELRRYRGQQVEVQGTLGATRDVSRATPRRSGSGNERSGAVSNGQSAGEPKSPQVGTGGSLRVPPSATPEVTQRPTEFQATTIRGIARTCPSAAR